jgi:hypothetical protein
MKPRPVPDPATRFVPCSWYEAVAEIERTDPRRFASFSTVTTKCLDIYLDMKARHHALQQRAA